MQYKAIPAYLDLFCIVDRICFDFLWWGKYAYLENDVVDLVFIEGWKARVLRCCCNCCLYYALVYWLFWKRKPYTAAQVFFFACSYIIEGYKDSCLFLYLLF